MAEEDQGSHCEEEGEDEEPIKVSVTFKPHEQEHESKSSPGGGGQICSVPEPDEPDLPANSPVTPSPSFLDTDKVNRDGRKTEQQEVFEGWKGYSNNIYIQPIIVHHASCDTKNCSSNKKTQQRLTSEDLRRQMRLREASHWITKHNDRIGSTGTLRVPRTSYDDTKYHQPKQAPKQRSPRASKVHKGFVCRTWATEFLPQEAQENEEDEFSPFLVRKYIDKTVKSGSSSTMEDSFPSDSYRSHENMRKDSSGFSTQDDDKQLPREDATVEKRVSQVQVKNKLSNSKSDNRRNERTGEKQIENSQKARNVSKDHGCTSTCRDKPTSETNPRFDHRCRSHTSQRKVRIALPIKQFPPINPLDETKKPVYPVRKPRRFLPNYRPHTVDTAFLTRDRSKKSGQYQPHGGGNYSNNGGVNYSNYSNHASLSANILCGRKVATSSSQKLKKDEQPGSKREEFDDVINLLSSSMEAWNADISHGEAATTQPVFHERRKRSASDSCVKMLLKQRSVDACASRGSLYRECVEQRFENNRRPTTPTHSKNCGDSKSDSDTDTGLGSEIEYSFDGSAKLDVYLKPRVMSFK